MSETTGRNLRFEFVLPDTLASNSNKTKCLVIPPILPAFGRLLALLVMDVCAQQAGKNLSVDFLIRLEPVSETMRQTANLAVLPQNESTLRNLAELFPNVAPVRVSISVSVTQENGQVLKENTAIEFATCMMAFFESRLPLELSDKLHLENSDLSSGTDAVVVAIRDTADSRAVAARIVSGIHNWAMQSQS